MRPNSFAKWLFFTIILPLLLTSISLAQTGLITGRVTDSRGRPLKGVEVRAVPLPLHDPYSDSAKEPQDTEHTIISDGDGRYRFKGVVASVGVKEGRCMQGYDIVAGYRGRSSPVIGVCKHPDDRSSVVEVDDLVIGE